MALNLTFNNWVCVDFEFVGDLTESPSNCRIWNIGAVKSDGTTFNVIMNVPTHMPTHTGCVEITEEYLRKNNAIDYKDGFMHFCHWVGPHAVIITHNCFKSDKLVLEAECQRHNLNIPHWYFYDSLIFFRTKIQCKSYKLVDLYEQIIGKKFQETHTALEDAKGLWEIIKQIPPDSLYMYPKYLTPLQNIKWVGTACEKCFIRNGVRSVENLVLNYMQWVQIDSDPIELMKQFLLQYNLPCNDLTAIATEIVKNWLPVTYGGCKMP